MLPRRWLARSGVESTRTLAASYVQAGYPARFSFQVSPSSSYSMVAEPDEASGEDGGPRRQRRVTRV